MLMIIDKKARFCPLIQEDKKVHQTQKSLRATNFFTITSKVQNDPL